MDIKRKIDARIDKQVERQKIKSNTDRSQSPTTLQGMSGEKMLLLGT
jgi:hypothetical protein